MIQPPAALIDRALIPRFASDAQLERWVRTNIIEEGPLHNPDHKHLVHASIGFLWTDAENTRRGQMIAGTAQFGEPTGSGWSKARAERQIFEWFKAIPDFLITLDAPYFDLCDQAMALAIVEHELYHCGQAVDEFGFPKFRKDSSLPVWAMKGHDVEEFVGVVRRYGAEAAQVQALVDAANREPQISAARIGKVCGTCLRAA